MPMARPPKATSRHPIRISRRRRVATRPSPPIPTPSSRRPRPRHNSAPRRGPDMATARYFVRDVDAGVTFYTQLLGFELRQQFGPNMAILKHRDLDLWLA